MLLNFSDLLGTVFSNMAQAADWQQSHDFVFCRVSSDRSEQASSLLIENQLPFFRMTKLYLPSLKRFNLMNLRLAKVVLNSWNFGATRAFPDSRRFQRNAVASKASSVTRCDNFAPLGQFFKSWALFSMIFIHFWAFFGQNFYLLEALLGQSILSKWLFFSKNLGSFLFKHLVTLKTRKSFPPFSVETLVCHYSGLNYLIRFNHD